MNTLLYHMYIEHEIYNMKYNKVRKFLNDHTLIESTIIKWDGYTTLLEIIINKGY